jgi:hypothetical protein
MGLFRYTCAISSDVLIILAMPFRLVTTASTAIEIPRLKSIAFIPAATDLHPSVNIAFVKTVAHVVPENWDKTSDVMVRIALTSFLQSKNKAFLL